MYYSPEFSREENHIAYGYYKTVDLKDRPTDRILAREEGFGSGKSQRPDFKDFALYLCLGAALGADKLDPSRGKS
ncbi:hypothetical protein TNCV_4544371 [Trichonephila clavipes]|nr:hypothetical protein TNCV_4544371 [Trichonephila clavipes]